MSRRGGKKGGKAPKHDDLPALGLFSRPTYLSDGDPYVKRNKGDARHKGRQMLTTIPKSGRTLDSFFEKTINPLFRDEPYVEPESHARRMRMAKGKKDLGGPWRPANPAKLSTGPGSTVGVIGSVAAHEPDFRVPMPGDGPVLDTRDGKRPPRNFVTNPPRQGGPGTLGRCVGEPNDKYVPEPAADLARSRARDRERDQAKRIGGPFRSRVSVVDSFDGGKVYEPFEPRASKRKGKGRRSGARGPGKPIGGPWKHASGIKSSKYDSPFGTTYPKYESDPLDAREKKAKQRGASRGKPLAGPFISTFKTTDDLPSKLARPVPNKW